MLLSPVAETAQSAATQIAGKDLLTISHLSRETVVELFQTARTMKANIRPYRKALDGKTVILLFEKASLRTKITFEVGVSKLGGTVLYMDHSNSRLGEREAVKDYGKNLERWIDCIVARVYSQRVIEELADSAKCPVINALSDRFHPCQGLADLFTLWERPGGLKGVKLAYIGDGNNVCHSLMHAATILGVPMTVVTPAGYEPAEDVVEECDELAKAAGSTVKISNDPATVEGHNAVYTDVWVSMGQDGEAAKRKKAFAKYQVNEALMARASKGVKGGSVFMHCLPAKRGVEVTDGVIDSPNSIVYDQAENRMHAQNSLLLHMFS